MDRLEGALDLRATGNRNSLAEKAIPNSLDRIEPGWKTGSPGPIKGGEGFDRKDVQSNPIQAGARLALLGSCVS
jgi:hypothetical protein